MSTLVQCGACEAPLTGGIDTFGPVGLDLCFRCFMELEDGDGYPCYGMFPGGDPRKFSPDPDCSTEAERAKHKADCEAWDRGEQTVKVANSTVGADGTVTHRCGSPYGLGVYT